MFGLTVTAIGFGTVFVVLVLLWGLIILKSKILAPRPKKVEQPQEVKAAPVEASAAKTEVDEEDEIAAVIAAAVAACGQQVVIKTIYRVTGSTGAAWAATGRTEAMNIRQI